MPIEDKLDQFVTLAREGLADLARNTVKTAADEARGDLQEFLADSETRLRKWAELLALGQLTREDFEILVRAQVTVLQFHRLVIAGKTKATVAKVRDGLTSLLIRSAVSALL